MGGSSDESGARRASASAATGRTRRSAIRYVISATIAPPNTEVITTTSPSRGECTSATMPNSSTPVPQMIPPRIAW